MHHILVENLQAPKQTYNLSFQKYCKSHISKCLPYTAPQICSHHHHLHHYSPTIGHPLTASKEGMAAKLGAVVVELVLLLLFLLAPTPISLLPVPSLLIIVVGFANALLGLEKAQAQFLFLPLTKGPGPGVAARWWSSPEAHDDEEEEEVMMNPPKSPPQGTLPFMASPAARAAEVDRRPSRWDSTRRSVQSPKPVEIRSKKSPEKLRLPHPTDLDRETFLPNDAVLLPLLFGLLSGSSTTTTTCSTLATAGSVVVSAGGGTVLGFSGFLWDKWRKDQKPLRRGLKSSLSEGK